MKKNTISWIFMSVAIASEFEPTDFNGISMIADGINHAIPTQKEMQSSLSWLFKKGLVKKEGQKYLLTSKGMQEYRDASVHAKNLFKIWENLELRINYYATQDIQNKI